MASPIRWGILGAGKISSKFAAGLGALPDAELSAVGARSLEKAAAFAASHGAARAHGSYAALAVDPSVDVVYIGTINTAHRENVLMCLDAGKPVLCEKPLMLNAGEVEEVVAAAPKP